MDPRFRILAMAVLPLLAGGCIVPELRSFVVRVDPTLHSAALQTSATHNACTVTARSGSHLRHDCRFAIAGTDKLARVFLQDSGIVDTLVDPLIVQVPDSALAITGIWSDGVQSGTLSVTPVVGDLPADLTRNIVAETGHKLAIVDFAPPVPPLDGRNYSFGLVIPVRNAVLPLPIKAMFAAKVVANGITYYPPMFPCATTFANLPALTLRESAAYVQVDLAAALAARPCDGSFYTFVAIPPASVDVVEYYHAGFDHYFVTWVADEIAALDAGILIRGWKRTQLGFKAHATAQPGTSPVCRFYIPPGHGDSHFYGRGAEECDATARKYPHLMLEAREFMYMILPDNGVCPPQTTVVYRVFSNRPDGNHRYMTDRALRDQMEALGWLPEGDGADRVVMCAPA